MITIEFVVIILCLLVGTRFGGMGLGLISGIGLFILSFVFGLQPGKPPVDVMLTILAVIGCAATLQTAGGLNVMMQFAERLLRRHPQHIVARRNFSHRNALNYAPQQPSEKPILRTVQIKTPRSLSHSNDEAGNLR